MSRTAACSAWRSSVAKTADAERFTWSDDDVVIKTADVGQLPGEPKLDMAAYERHLNDARLRLAVPSGVIRFDPAKHGRDLHGRFREMVDKLEVGQSVELPSGESVRKTHAGGRYTHDKGTWAVKLPDT